MPGYTGHAVANGVALVGTSAFMYWQGWSPQDIFFVDSGIVISTLILSPDMDLFTSKPMNGWGVLRIFWLPYSKLVKHRDRLHMPILGTTVRWLYTLGLLSLLILLFRFWFRRIGLQVEFTFDGDRDDIIFNLLYLLDVYIGATIADTLHYVLDMVTHELGRAIPRRSRRYVRERDPSF